MPRSGHESNMFLGADVEVVTHGPRLAHKGIMDPETVLSGYEDVPLEHDSQ